MSMMRWVLLLVGGTLLGGIVHLATMLMLPRAATQDAYARLTPAALQINRMVQLPAASPQNTAIPFMDPAFAVAVCRYDLTNGPIKFTAPVSNAYTSVSFYTRSGVAYYAINDRAAGRRIIELNLMTTEQREQLPAEEDVTAADRLIVEAPSNIGLIVLRALAAEPGMMPLVRNTVAAAQCRS
jgi:uncharacterized membrane protein